MVSYYGSGSGSGERERKDIVTRSQYFMSADADAIGADPTTWSLNRHFAMMSVPFVGLARRVGQVRRMWRAFCRIHHAKSSVVLVYRNLDHYIIVKKYVL